MHISPEHITVAILILSATVYALLQSAKKFLPGLCGRHAVAVNAVLNLVGLVMVLPSGQVLTLHTLSLLVTAIATAGGFHGVIKTLSPGGAKENSDGAEPTSPAVALLLLLVLAPSLAGCAHQIKPATAPPLPVGAVDATDATANKVLQAAHGFAARVTADVLTGKIKLTPNEKLAVGQFNLTLNAAEAVEMEYHRCGVARQLDGTLPPCENDALVRAVAGIESAFGNIELTLAGK